MNRPTLVDRSTCPQRIPLFTMICIAVLLITVWSPFSPSLHAGQTSEPGATPPPPGWREWTAYHLTFILPDDWLTMSPGSDREQVRRFVRLGDGKMTIPGYPFGSTDALMVGRGDEIRQMEEEMIAVLSSMGEVREHREGLLIGGMEVVYYLASMSVPEAFAEMSIHAAFLTPDQPGDPPTAFVFALMSGTMKDREGLVQTVLDSLVVHPVPFSLYAWMGSGEDGVTFDSPSGLACDGTGNLYVVDRGNHRILVYHPEDNLPPPWGNRGYEPGELSYPDGIALNREGNVYPSHALQPYLVLGFQPSLREAPSPWEGQQPPSPPAKRQPPSIPTPETLSDEPSASFYVISIEPVDRTLVPTEETTLRIISIEPVDRPTDPTPDPALQVVTIEPVITPPPVPPITPPVATPVPTTPLPTPPPLPIIPVIPSPPPTPTMTPTPAPTPILTPMPTPVFEPVLLLEPAELPEINTGEPIRFTVTLLHQPDSVTDIRYVWSFGDGTDPVYTDDRDLTHTFQRSGQFDITAKAFDKATGTMVAMVRIPTRAVTPGPTLLTHREQHPNGQTALQYTFYLDGAGNRVKHGTETAWYDNGRKRAEGPFQDGLRQGTWTSWYDNGSIGQSGPYVNDQRHGTWTIYYRSGRKYSEGPFRNDQRHGTWTKWHEDGRKQAELDYQYDTIVAYRGA